MGIPSPLEKKIVAGQMPELAYLLLGAAKQLGSSIDAWHDYSAASLISAGREEELIAGMDELVEDKGKGYRPHREGT